MNNEIHGALQNREQEAMVSYQLRFDERSVDLQRTLAIVESEAATRGDQERQALQNRYEGAQQWQLEQSDERFAELQDHFNAELNNEGQRSWHIQNEYNLVLRTANGNYAELHDRAEETEELKEALALANDYALSEAKQIQDWQSWATSAEEAVGEAQSAQKQFRAEKRRLESHVNELVAERANRMAVLAMPMPTPPGLTLTPVARTAPRLLCCHQVSRLLVFPRLAL